MSAEPTDPTWVEVKAAYWRQHGRVREEFQGRMARTDPARSDDDFWAWEYVNSLCRNGDRPALDRLVDLADSASSDEELAYLRAGPVEDLVRDFGEVLIDDIEAAAERSPSFLGALQGMYGIVVPDTIRVRMVALVPATVFENRIRQEQGKAPL